MVARRAMTRDVVIVPPELDLDAAMRTMRGRHIHHLVVGTAEGICGMLSQRDVDPYVQSGDGRAALAMDRVADAMRPVVATCSPDTPIPDVARAMRELSAEAVLVLGDAGRLVGVITRTDLLNCLYEPETLPTIDYVDVEWDDDWLTDGGAGS